MSPTLAVSLNVLADLGLLALLTFVMSQARRLTPHGATLVRPGLSLYAGPSACAIDKWRA